MLNRPESDIGIIYHLVKQQPCNMRDERLCMMQDGINDATITYNTAKINGKIAMISLCTLI